MRNELVRTSKSSSSSSLWKQSWRSCERILAGLKWLQVQGAVSRSEWGLLQSQIPGWDSRPSCYAPISIPMKSDPFWMVMGAPALLSTKMEVYCPACREEERERGIAGTFQRKKREKSHFSSRNSAQQPFRGSWDLI